MLWVYAHPNEARGLELSHLQCIGVGKARAACQLTAALVGAQHRVECVVNFGVAGAFAGHGLDVGDVCFVVEECWADEGIELPDGFNDLAALGLENRDASRWSADVEWTNRLSAVLGAPPRVRGTTVSTCSGTDSLAARYAKRTNAAVETMEGAAVAQACERAGLPWVQVRAISNRTGNRSAGGWDFPRAVKSLHDAVRRMASSVSA